MLAGALMQTGARVGMHVMSKTLSDRYLRAANERIFAPLGLRVRLCKTPALRKLVEHPEMGKEEPSKLKKFGQSAGNVILAPPTPYQWAPPSVSSWIRLLLSIPGTRTRSHVA